MIAKNKEGNKSLGKEVRMRKIQRVILIAGLLFSLIAGAEDKQSPNMIKKFEPLQRALAKRSLKLLWYLRWSRPRLLTWDV